MTRIARWFWVALGALFATTALAQAPERRTLFSPAELDQILAPIALYPDSLLSQVLMASTYPRDLAEAASWSRVHGLRGEEAVRAAGDRDWDPSVTSLVAFPEVLSMLDERGDWSARLGEAFLAQPGEVMDSVQGLRARADAAGTLRSSEEMMVQRQGEDYVIEPTQAEEVYVPYYDPREAYGTWGWPAYQPVYWAPWPGYSYGYGYPSLYWGPSVWVGGSFFYGRFDWHRHHVRYTHHRPWYHHGRHWRAGGHWGGGDSDRRRDQGGWRRGDGRNGGDGRNRADGRSRDEGRYRDDGRYRRAAAPSTDAQGYFRPGQSPQSPVARASSERARAAAVLPQAAPVAGAQQPSAGGHPMMRSVAPQLGTPGGRVQGQGRRQAATPPVDAPRAPAPAMPAARHSAPAVQHSAPVHQAPAPAARAPTQRSRESAAPAARESAPSRSSSSDSASAGSGPAARAERGRAASR